MSFNEDDALLLFLPWIITCAPDRASSSAVRLPMPSVAPVTRMIRSLVDIISGILGLKLFCFLKSRECWNKNTDRERRVRDFILVIRNSVN
jgi:hypothetical protein